MADKGTAQSFEEEGKEAFDRGDYLSAAHRFAEAAQRYSDRSDALMAAEMKSNQSVAFLRAKQANQALEVISGVSKIFKVSGDVRREGIALGNQAAALAALKRKQEAISCYKQAAGLLEKAGEDGLRWKTMQQVTLLHASSFKFIDAVLSMQSGLMGIKNPNWKQRVMKALLFMRV